ncbi:uncharacterized protein LOC115339288 [Aquila chrysaetos chrysaetos]|uniref:uncharacterized protein LOC115339288 n=1 Tax=Aquila chrysaetos chrysaetos TaxID=223781 RepID=UPI001176F595|nr:uncharacterized protein LOC115339288 [Aquila chrysaetos chrysaetos]
MPGIADGMRRWMEEEELAPIDRGGQPDAGLGAPEQPPPLISGAKVQAGSTRRHRDSLSQAAVPLRSTMRLWLLCGFAATVALVAVARADHGDSKKVARGREGMSSGGRRRPHRPCSGCFSVLSEESQSTSWHAREDDEVQPGRRGRARREDKEPAQPMRHPGSVLLPWQEALSTRTVWRGGVPAAGRSPTPGESRGSGHPQAVP